MIQAEAQADIRRQGRYLKSECGRSFAVNWVRPLQLRLQAIASGGAQIGTGHPTHPKLKTFGYQNQATSLAEFTDDELRVIRVYFAGQDWNDL